MVWERKVLIDNKSYMVVVSDEIQALLAAKAAGRAVVGVTEGSRRDMGGIPYVVPAPEDATEELLELVLRRHLGLPWFIERTGRLVIREFVREDAPAIPQEEYGREEEIFRSPELLALYIKNQYGFYEYGTWAVVHRETGELIGMAGVSNPRLPEDMEIFLTHAGMAGRTEAMAGRAVCGADLQVYERTVRAGGPGDRRPLAGTWLSYFQALEGTGIRKGGCGSCDALLS